MHAVVMAGGEGSRLRPLTVGRPKPMAPIVNKPVIGHAFDLLKSHEISDAVVTLRYLASVIQDFFQDGSSVGMNLAYAVEESPLGTAGSVKYGARHIDDTFLVISGDALTDFDLRKIVQFHKAKGAMATITLARVPDPLEYGVIVTDEEGHVLQFLEKPGWAEVISDTVNTGIYVLEPEVLDLIPDKTNYDFSKQLFPLMLQQQMPIYGCIADGYWCDVGTIEEYRRANADILNGRVELPNPIGEHIGGGVWVGEDVEISPSAQLFGPIYLGNHVKIKGDVFINGPSVIRDYTVVDNYTQIERSIVWRNCYIGESCDLRGVVISRQCSIKSHVVGMEGVVIGDNCGLGEGCVISPNVKLWPRKEIEPGAIVKESIIWGSQGRRGLFGRFGVSGVVNVDLTPEFAAKLGAALGATLPLGSYAAINRDAHRSSRMLKRAITSGLPGAGVNVWDTDSVAIPVLRHFVNHNPNIMAGIHVRLSPFDQRVVDIRFIDQNGLNLSRTTERDIERIFTREDFRRAYLNEMGVIDYQINPIKAYQEDFLQFVDTERIRQAHFKIVIDYSHGLAADALADILTQLGVDVVPLNARVDESKLAMLQERFNDNLQQVAQIVTAVEADLGFQLDVGGEKLFLVDEKGQMIDEIVAAELMCELALFGGSGRAVAAPVTMPNALETIAGWHKSHVIRTRNDIQALMIAHEAEPIQMAVDGTGNYIFPGFQMAIDGMMGAVFLLQQLALRELSLSQVVAYLPPVNLARGPVACPWELKGKVMRLLNEMCDNTQTEKLDGIKFVLNEAEWVHVTPNPDKPQFEISAEAADKARAKELMTLYQQKITNMLDS
ncbi:MAG: NTP transferase domain-containing protein [Caldilineaceae bacterium]|nr:NTP transferase domain-containing protein [Caldilineaceae bacterium]